MKLLIQPENGIAPLVAAIRHARKSVNIVIFRFDRTEIEAALKAAAVRGVAVTALIASANNGGEKNLRKLEMRLLAAGVTVSRTAGDLVRYHDKLLIIDRRVLYMLSFNLTYLDVDHSRGFGVITRKKRLVHEALKLLAADSERVPYEAGLDTFIVSPINARKQLLELIRRARKELLIYDPHLVDAAMLKALNERRQRGVDVRVIGSAGRRGHRLKVRALEGFRLHARAIIRDRREAFVGSQSLRKGELDSRREVGLIVRDSKVVGGLRDTFQADWAATEFTDADVVTPEQLKKTLKAQMRQLADLDPLVKEALNEVVSKTDGSATLTTKEMKNAVENAVKEAVRERVHRRATRRRTPASLRQHRGGSAEPPVASGNARG
jgi:phosphatidylserine/phosphatidylglycerophosphate/cardiolipin synthase-like enzyme